MIELLRDFSLNAVLGILSWIVPKNSSRILLGAHYGLHFRGNPKFFYLYLQKQSSRGIEAVWITRSEAVYEDLSRRDLPVVRMFSASGFWTILRSAVLLTSYNLKDVSYFQILPGRFSKIQTYHGLPLKGHIPHLRSLPPRPLGYWLFRWSRGSYRAFLTTSEETAALERGFFFRNILALGYPRNDLFFDRELAFIDYRKLLGLAGYSKLILYCPTFRDAEEHGVPFTAEFAGIINGCLEDRNWLLLVSDHPNGGVGSAFSGFSHIMDISRRVQDIQELLLCTDILVTDYSSAVFDYMLTGKPVVFYPYDYEDYSRSRGFLLDYFTDLPGPFADSQENLLELLASVDDWSESADYRRRYESLVNRFHKFRDANASSRLLDYIESEII